MGSNVVIMCGITVEENAMVAAGSVVIRDVPAYTMVCGNPAEVKGRVNEQGKGVI